MHAPEPAVGAGFAKPMLLQWSLSAGDVFSGHRPLGALDLMAFSIFLCTFKFT